jgi:glycosyltransferase involved in cell wall biosynthesis
VLVDDAAGLVDETRELLTDRVLREELGAKAQARSLDFSWRTSADAMRGVLSAVAAGERVSGVV